MSPCLFSCQMTAPLFVLVGHHASRRVLRCIFFFLLFILAFALVELKVGVVSVCGGTDAESPTLLSCMSISRPDVRIFWPRKKSEKKNCLLCTYADDPNRHSSLQLSESSLSSSPSLETHLTQQPAVSAVIKTLCLELFKASFLYLQVYNDPLD